MKRKKRRNLKLVPMKVPPTMKVRTKAVVLKVTLKVVTRVRLVTERRDTTNVSQEKVVNHLRLLSMLLTYHSRLMMKSLEKLSRTTKSPRFTLPVTRVVSPRVSVSLKSKMKKFKRRSLLNVLTRSLMVELLA